MNLLPQLAGLLPQPWIKFVSRAQWRHPLLKWGFEWCAERFRNQDGTILHGVGKGLRFNPGRANAGFLLGTSEPAVQYALSVLAKPGMVMYDIGANVGFLTVIAARLVGQQGRVIAFEPLPDNFDQIQHNAALNRFTQVTARCEALSSTDGKATFQVSADPTWGKLVGVGSTVAQKVGEIEVTVSRLDTVLHEADLPSPDLIKIDVEGAEADVLDGAAETLRQSRPILLIELHGTNQAIAERLKGLNYSAVTLGSSASIVDSPWDAYVIAAPSERPDLVHSIGTFSRGKVRPLMSRHRVSCGNSLVHPRRRLLSIAHSYCVALNRRLAHEMARLGAGEWEVTAVAPAFFHGDLRAISLESCNGEPCGLEPVSAYLSRYIHVMFYGRRLREIIQQGWDLIHCWEEPYIFAGAQVAWWTPPKTPLVYVTAQNISKNYPPPFAFLERNCMRRASGWVAFGHSIEQALLDRPFYADRRRRVIPMGVDLERFYPDPEARKRVRERLGWNNSGPAVVGFLGRFVPEKGLEIFTATLDSLSCPWRALIVGGGPLEQKLLRWAIRYGERVRVVTGVKHDQVPAYLNAMDTLCVPSQTTRHWREQFGRILIEGFACGVPVVASVSGEIPYVVAGAGIVVGEKDQAGWAAAVAELLENPDRRRELAGKGIERAQSEFSWTVVAKKHLEFFDEISSNAA